MENQKLFMPMNIFRQVAGMGKDDNLEFWSKGKGKRPIAFTNAGTVYCSLNYSEKKPTFIMAHQGGTHNGVDKSHLRGTLWAVNSDLQLVVPSDHVKVERPTRKGK